MTFERIKELEEKYWKGETTLEEEELLRRAAKEKPHLVSNSICNLFDSIREDEETLSSEFESEFWSKVDKKENKSHRLFTTAQFFRYAAAAVLAIAIGFAVWFSQGEENLPVETASLSDTYEDPEVAFEEAKKALMFASEKLNKAEAPAREIRKFHQAKMSISSANLNEENNENDK